MYWCYGHMAHIPKIKLSIYLSNFGVTRPERELKTYCMRDEHANHLATPTRCADLQNICSIIVQCNAVYYDLPTKVRRRLSVRSEQNAMKMIRFVEFLARLQHETSIFTYNKTAITHSVRVVSN